MSSPEFYRNALAYDIAFSDRDFAAECDFLQWCLDTLGGVDPGVPRSCVELACGPGRHAQEFARRGWRALGLDLSEAMLAYAQDVAQRNHARVEWIAADMTDFTLPQPVTLATNLMESLSHLCTNEAVVDHLRAVARNLVPGGVFVIETGHPATIWRDNLPNAWTSTSNDVPIFAHEPYTEVDVLFGAADDPYDWISQIWTVTTRLTIRQNGGVRQVEHHHPHRWYLAQELRALIDLSGAFSQTTWFGDLALPIPPLDSSDACPRMVAVLRK